MQRRFRRVYAKKTPPETFQTTAVFRAKNGRTKKQAHCSRRSARKKSTSQVELVLKCFTSLRRERALTAILLTCNPENRNSPRPFPTFSQRLTPLQWLPFGHTAHGCFGTASCSQLRSSGLVTFPFSSRTARSDNPRLHVTDEAYSIFRPDPAPPSGPGRFPLHYTKLPPKVNAGFW